MRGGPDREIVPDQRVGAKTLKFTA